VEERSSDFDEKFSIGLYEKKTFAGIVIAIEKMILINQILITIFRRPYS